MIAVCAAWGQDYKPGDFQAANPNYPNRNPFYFEGRIDWDLLNIDQPSSAWEFAQRGIHKQDDLEDIPGAIQDYRTAISMNSRVDGSCQLIRSVPVGFGRLNPSPCMFTVRLRLANLLKKEDPLTAISLLDEVLEIDPLRLGVNALKGETYVMMASTASPPNQARLLRRAVSEYKAELALSPVTPLSVKLTGDEANNAHVHWALAAIYDKLREYDNEATELDLYLKATKWHSDTYPWRLSVAQRRLDKLRQNAQ